MGLLGLDDAGDVGARFLLLARQRLSSSSRNRLPLLGNLLRYLDDAGEVGARGKGRPPAPGITFYCLGIFFDLMIPKSKI